MLFVVRDYVLNDERCFFDLSLQVLLSQSHRFRALVLLGRFLDMGAWALDLVTIISLSVLIQSFAPVVSLG